MADVFDIDNGYHRKSSDGFNRRQGGGWKPVETKSASRNDPRLARRDENNKRYSRSPSPKRRSPPRHDSRGSHKYTSEHKSSPPPLPTERDRWHSPQRQMYSEPPPLPPQTQTYQQPPPPPMYSQYNTGYPGGTTSSYQHGYQQAYQQTTTATGFNQYTTSTGYPQNQQGYNSGQQQQHQQPNPPGDEYPGGAWTAVQSSGYASQQNSHPPVPAIIPRPPASNTSTAHSDTKNDDLKKEAGIAQEKKQQRATLIKQREEYLRKASVLRRELEKLRMQKHDLLTEKSPPRDAERILHENAKLQLEIQNKLKSINTVVDMLSGIIGDGLKSTDDEVMVKSNFSDTSSSAATKRSRKEQRSPDDSDLEPLDRRSASRDSGATVQERGSDTEWPRCNYVHYDPELHWCRACDIFPRSAKDYLNHLHSAEHRQVTQEHQLNDAPWHKVVIDPELPTIKGAHTKRVPIKGLQFFISATAWYCKLCDVWIGDLHCASLHLKGKNHSQNFSNFVEQNPHWENDWLKDREKAHDRCAKLKFDAEKGIVPPAPEPPVINEKSKSKKRKDKLDPSASDKKKKKKSKKRKKNHSSETSSSSSSSSDSSSEDESDKAKSIRVSMRNKMRMQARMILNEELGGKLDALTQIIKDESTRKKDTTTGGSGAKEVTPQEPSSEDNIINQWMTVAPNNTDKHILDNLKGRLKQRQEADKEKAAMEAVAEQRRRDREREERELKELQERDQKEMEEKMREEEQQRAAEREREQKERIKERERHRRKRISNSRSPEPPKERKGRSKSRSRGRSRSRSVSRRRYGGRGRSPPARYRRSDSSRRSPEEKFKSLKRDYEDDETQFEKHTSKSRSSKTSSNSRKLPFIGRMPLFKKRTEGGEEKEIKKEDYEIRLSKFEPGQTARAFIPEPGVVHITKLASQPEPSSFYIHHTAENPPPPPKIIPEPPQISEAPPPPPTIHPPPIAPIALQVQDMELDEGAPPLPPGVPVIEAKPLAKPAGNHLPREFQEALNIIFPGDQRPENFAALQSDPNLMMQYQYSMGYGMMYPGMQMYDYSGEELMKDESGGDVGKTDENDAVGEEVTDDKEDLAMLGIDAEDMAAQTF